MFSSPPNWLNFKRWRSRRPPADESSGQTEQQQPPPPSSTTTSENAPELLCSGGGGSTGQPQAPPRGRRRRTKTEGHPQQQQPSEHQTGRRLPLLPRSLVGLIGRALSPAPGASQTSGDRPKSPLRKLKPQPKKLLTRSTNEQHQVQEEARFNTTTTTTTSLSGSSAGQPTAIQRCEKSETPTTTTTATTTTGKRTPNSPAPPPPPLSQSNTSKTAASAAARGTDQFAISGVQERPAGRATEAKRRPAPPPVPPATRQAEPPATCGNQSSGAPTIMSPDRAGGNNPSKEKLVCHLTAKTKDNQCALHGQPTGGNVIGASRPSKRTHSTTPMKTTHKTPTAATTRPRRSAKQRAARVACWPLAKSTLNNNDIDDRRGHFGDCEDILSAHLAGRLSSGLAPYPSSRLPACNSYANYNHRRPFGQSYEPSTTGWLYNSTGLNPTNPGSSTTLKAKLNAARGFRRRSYDDQEGDNDINIILQPGDLEEIERETRAKYARYLADRKVNRRKTRRRVGKNNVDDDHQDDDHHHQNENVEDEEHEEEEEDDDDFENKQRNFTRFECETTNLLLSSTTGRSRLSAPTPATTSSSSSSFSAITTETFNTTSRTKAMKTSRFLAMTNIFNDVKLANCLLDQEYNQTVHLFIKKCALNWNFNSFTFDAMCCGRSLTELLLHLFDYYNLYNIFKLDIVKVLKCFRLLEFGYHPTNPYHNSVHAADVTQAMHCFIQEKKIKSYMTDLEILCSILAAVCHDLDHPGVNQSFLVATNNPLASLYQNNSVLENHHWRFALCIFKESKLFDHFSSDLYDNMKEQLKHLILATDIARQNDYLKRFKELTSSKEFSMENVDDRALVLQMALKCADLGNPCRPWLISRVWSNLICDEFYRMGQIERRLGVPLTPICQREKTSIAGIQTDFFRFIVLPLLELWHKFLASPLSELLMSNFDHNYKRWQRANRIVQQLRRRKSVACLEPVLDSDSPSVDEDSEATPTTCETTTPQLEQATSRLLFDPDMATYYANHPFGAIKRAASDYIKSGNGRLELLRDFQLDRIIERSPMMRKSGRFGAKSKTDACKKPQEPQQKPLESHTSDQHQHHHHKQRVEPTSELNRLVAGCGPSTAAAAAPQQRHQPMGHQSSVSQRKMLSPIEDGEGPSPEAQQPPPKGCKSSDERRRRKQAASLVSSGGGQESADLPAESSSSSSSSSCSSGSESRSVSRASSACSSPIMQRSVSSRTSIEQQLLNKQQHIKQKGHRSTPVQNHPYLAQFYEPTSGGGKLKPSAQQARQSVAHPSGKVLYHGKRRESDPGRLTDNYELAAAIVLIQYQSNKLFHKRRSSLPVCVPKRRSSK